MSEMLNVSFDNCETLAEVVTVAEEKARQQGRVVCGVLLNGKRLNESDEAQMGTMSVANIHSLSFETEDPEELVISTVKTQLALIDEIERMGNEVAIAFRGPDIGRAQSLLINWLDSCKWLTDALVVMKGAQNWLAIDKSSWAEGEKQFQIMISQILAAVEREDFVELADTLQYELANGLAGWRNLLAGMVR